MTWVPAAGRGNNAGFSRLGFLQPRDHNATAIRRTRSRHRAGRGSRGTAGRVALAKARAGRELPFRYVAADQVRVERRGAGSCARRVHNFATPDVLDADRLIGCEVITPAGNWSSYPPHKHDRDRHSRGE